MSNIVKSVTAAERKKLPHAGPHNSFPLSPELLKSAWNLAGHAANPDAVRAKIKAYARKHGLTGRLPQTALAKATQGAMREIIGQAYNQTYPDSYQREKLLRTAAKNNVLDTLPPAAHADLHRYHIPHDHPNHDGIVPTFDGEDEANPGGGNDPDDNADPYLHHAHVVTKAFNPKAFNGSIVKSWDEDGNLYFEGWMSTPHKDLEKDITEPEAFSGGPLKEYFQRSAPLALDHQDNHLPIGHLQKAAIIRQGRVIETASHPIDPAEFSRIPSLPAESGVWVRGVVTEEPAKSAVVKGNVAGMSFIGNGVQFEPLPGGGKRYTKIDPLVESTLAAYPINSKAMVGRVQKALGMNEEEDFDFMAFLEEAAQNVARNADISSVANAQTTSAEPVAKGVTKDDLAALLNAIDAKIDEKIAKAQVPVRGEGAGRQGTIPPAPEDDPASYILQKATTPEQMTPEDREFTMALMTEYMFPGMKD